MAPALFCFRVLAHCALDRLGVDCVVMKVSTFTKRERFQCLKSSLQQLWREEEMTPPENYVCCSAAVTFAVNWEKSGSQFLISPLGPYLHPDRPKYAMIIVVSGPENMSIKKNLAINQKIKRGGVNPQKWSTPSVRHTWKSVHQKELCDHQEILNPSLGIPKAGGGRQPTKMIILKLEKI